MERFVLAQFVDDSVHSWLIEGRATWQRGMAEVEEQMPRRHKTDRSRKEAGKQTHPGDTPGFSPLPTRLQIPTSHLATINPLTNILLP